MMIIRMTENGVIIKSRIMMIVISLVRIPMMKIILVIIMT